MTAGALPRRGVGTKLVQEVRLVKTRNDGWRWDVVNFATAQTTNSGVYDGRIHQGGQCGYARTKRGALRQIAKHLRVEVAYEAGQA